MMHKLPSNGTGASYAKKMITHHQSAVDMSRALLRQGVGGKLKGFAEDVIDAQTKEIAWLRKWIADNTGDDE